MDVRKSEIQEFYSGRSVFLTGASGYLGKAVLEKLLRSCPDMDTVYVLLRPKHDVHVDFRLTKILQSPIFDKLKSEYPDAVKKVSAISGDISLPNLGITEHDREKVCQSVSLVIHSAASVKFNEPLKAALNINYNGTQRILKLCQEMKHLRALVHVSTAYANCDLKEVSEDILLPKCPLTPEEIQSMSDEKIAAITPLILGKKPNTYTYAKCQAENLLKEHGGMLPISIVRPSIIGAAWKEPQAGYVDSLNGMTGLIAATGKGMLTSMVCGRDKVADVIPLDATVNLILAAAWDTATNPSAEIEVFNCCSGSINPVTNGDIWKYTNETLAQYPFNQVLRHHSLRFVKTQSLNRFLNLWLNILPFFLLDSITVLTRRKPILLKSFNKVQTALHSMTFFHMNEWTFESENMGRLERRLGCKDREIFFWNIRDMDMQQYFRDYCLGIKKWVFKEDLRDLVQAKAHRKRMTWLHRAYLLFLILNGLLLARIIGLHFYGQSWSHYLQLVPLTQAV